jgi:hypothetical protein
MAKCSVVGCTEPAIGGFRELIDVANFQNPTATAPGLHTQWCAMHESMVRPSVLGKRGEWLAIHELKN